ncbi:MAG TPA: condensation domain-containing protein [Acidimicrobiales bacterium]
MSRVAPARTVPELLGRRAATTPGAPALEMARGSTLSFEAWEARSNAAARGLAHAGVEPGAAVAMVFNSRGWIDLAVAYVAAQKVGATAVPLSPGLAIADITRVLTDCGAALVVTEASLGQMADATASCSLADLEAGQATAALDEVPAASDAELRYPVGALRPAQAQRWSHADILGLLGHGDPAVVSGPSQLWAAEPGVFVHAFPAGSRAAIAAFVASLDASRGPSVAMAGSGPFGIMDPHQLRSMISNQRPASVGMSGAAARALVDTAPDRVDDLSSLKLLVLTADPGLQVLDALSASFPDATTSVLSGAYFDDAACRRPTSMAGAVEAPVAGSQVGMVWYEQFTPGSFNLPPLTRRYQGPLDVSAMESALNEIMARHDALRATFSIIDGEPIQIFLPPAPFRLPVIDLGACPDAEAGNRLDDLIAEARNRPFDLSTGPLFAPTLVRLAPEDHVMIIRVHHSVFDDASVDPFRAELSALYTAFTSGQPSPLPPLRGSFADVCRQERPMVTGASPTAERSFWRGELAGAPATMELPIGDPDQPAGAPLRAADPVRVELGTDVAAAMRTLAHDERATVFMVALAAFAVVLGRYCEADDLVLSTLNARRHSRDDEAMIGCFATKIVLRLSLAGDPSFAEVIRRTRRAVMTAIAHKDMAFEAVVQDELGSRAAVHGLSARVSVKFQAAVTSVQRLSLPGLTISAVPATPPSPPPHFLSAATTAAQRPVPIWGAGLYEGTFLGLSLSEAGERLAMTAEGVFHPPAVRRLLGHVVDVATESVRSPKEPISKLVMSGEGRLERRRTADEAVDLDGFAVDPARIEAALADCPGLARVAIVVREDGDGRRRLVAYVVAASGSSAPALGQLRRHLWTKIPGYAWPAAMVTVDDLPEDVDPAQLPAPLDDRDDSRGPDAGEAVLSALWAEAGGAGDIEPSRNYWQSFSFLDAVTAARQCGIDAGVRMVTRNRTVEALAVDLAAQTGSDVGRP